MPERPKYQGVLRDGAKVLDFNSLTDAEEDKVFQEYFDSPDANQDAKSGEIIEWWKKREEAKAKASEE